MANFDTMRVFHRSLNLFLDKLDALIIKKNLNRFRYSRSSLARRLGQLIHNEIYVELAQNFKSGRKDSNAFKNLTFDFMRGSIALRGIFFLRNLIMFVGHWQRQLFTFLYFSWSRSNAYKKTFTLFECFDLSRQFANSEGRDMKDWCQRGTIEFIRKSDVIIIGCNFNLEDKANGIYFSTDPLRSVIQLSHWSWEERWRFLYLHFTNFFRFIFCAVREPMLSLLYRDIAIDATFKIFSDKKIIDYFCFTISNYNQQKLPWVDFPDSPHRSHLFFYSTNVRMLQFKGFEAPENYPIYRYMKVDEAWVWNHDQKTWLESVTKTKMTHICGSNMFYLPESSPPRIASTNKFVISIFDVTPERTSFLDTVGFIWYDYYNEENMKKFLSEILDCVNELGSEHFEVLLKPKRRFIPAHEEAYLKYIEDLNDSKQIRVLHHTTNMYSMISQSDLVICIPFSSPSCVASELGKTTIFYEPMGQLECNYKLPERTFFLSEKSELNQNIKQFAALKFDKLKVQEREI